MTENSQQRPTTGRTSSVRSATDEDLARDFASSKLLCSAEGCQRREKLLSK